MTKNGNYDTKNGSLTCNYDGQSSEETIKDVLHFKKLTYLDRVGWCVNVQKVFKMMNPHRIHHFEHFLHISI